jgi:hypothetical protein
VRPEPLAARTGPPIPASRLPGEPPCGHTIPHAPALHLLRLSAGDLFETYTESFEMVCRRPDHRNGKDYRWHAQTTSTTQRHRRPTALSSR